jgi:hypothetical protein
MLYFKFIDFDTDIIKKVISDSLQDHTAIVFPNVKSADIARRELLAHWSFEDILIITMEDVNAISTLSEQTLLQDSKRHLLLYQSIAQSLKEKYRLTDYFAAYRFMSDFFGIFTELCTECIDIDSIDAKLISQGHFADWQTEFWCDLLKIRDDYKKSLQSTAYADIIFVQDNHHAVDAYFIGYKHIVFANQFYFTEKEKSIIHRLSQHKKITLYYQLPERLVEQKSLKVLDFHIGDLCDPAKRQPHICLYSAPDTTLQLSSALSTLKSHDIKSVVDYNVHDQSWFRMLSKQIFSKPARFSMRESEVYIFFEILHRLMMSLKTTLHIRNIKKYVLPLHDVYTAFQSHHFRYYFFPEMQRPDPTSATSFAYLDIFFESLAHRGYLYLDPFYPTEILRHIASEATTDKECISTGFTRFAELIKSLISVKSMGDLIRLIDTESGIMLRNICSDDTLRFTDALEQFYTTLSNVCTIEEHLIVTDWTKVFHSSHERPICIPLLKYFTQSLQVAKVNYRSDFSGIVHFDSLNDTRNMSYDKVLFLNCNDGILPKAKSPDFLFHERQREIIGLKTYHDFLIREKYYFYRTLLTAKESHLFFVENIEEKTERSSFIEEIMIYMGQCLVAPTEKIKCSANIAEKKATSHVTTTIGHTLPSDFLLDFTLTDGDPPIPKIKLTAYALNELLADPFAWYITRNLKISDKVQPLPDTIDTRYIGNITHLFVEKWVAAVTKQNAHADDGICYLSRLKSSLSDQYLDDVFLSLRHQSHFYKYPLDFSGIYFEKILLNFIKATLRTYFCSDSISNIAEDSIVDTEAEFGEKLFLNTENYHVYVSGKADMVITETTATGARKYIIDFKTGKETPNQLLIYQWLAQTADTVDTIATTLNLLGDTSDAKWQTMKTGTLADLQSKLKNTLDMCVSHGYTSPTSRSLKAKFLEINRADIVGATDAK